METNITGTEMAMQEAPEILEGMPKSLRNMKDYLRCKYGPWDFVCFGGFFRTSMQRLKYENTRSGPINTLDSSRSVRRYFGFSRSISGAWSSKTLEIRYKACGVFTGSEKEDAILLGRLKQSLRGPSNPQGGLTSCDSF